MTHAPTWREKDAQHMSIEISEPKTIFFPSLWCCWASRSVAIDLTNHNGAGSSGMFYFVALLLFGVVD